MIINAEDDADADADADAEADTGTGLSVRETLADDAASESAAAMSSGDGCRLSPSPMGEDDHDEEDDGRCNAGG